MSSFATRAYFVFFLLGIAGFLLPFPFSLEGPQLVRPARTFFAQARDILLVIRDNISPPLPDFPARDAFFLLHMLF